MLGEIVFVGLLACVGWHYVGYPIFIGILYSVRGVRYELPDPVTLPKLAVVITVHNEVDIILDRLENCFQSQYPVDQLEVIVASDGSTDGTVERVRSKFPNVTVVVNNDRNKAVTRQRGVDAASSDILVFTDAETRFHPGCLERLASHFANPNVGVVGGRLVSDDLESGGIGRTMRLYWQWEYFLRQAHAGLGLLPKLSGANMAIRNSCFNQESDYVDIDQTAGFDALREGFLILYEPTAIATEQFPTKLGSELSVRRRLTAQACTTLWQYKDVINPRQKPLLWFATVSYWPSRYLIPWLLLSAFLLSVMLAGTSLLATTVLVSSLIMGVFGIGGYFLDRSGWSLQPFSFAFAFLWVNLGILIGTIEFAHGRRINSYRRH